MAVYEERESYAASRALGIGGTDAAAILGLSPWKAPIDVYAGKVDPDSIPELDKECLVWGNLLEPIVRERYAQKFGLEVVAPANLHAHFPRCRKWNDSDLLIGNQDWMLGAPDGWVPVNRHGLEIKTAARKAGEWGEEGSDEIPAHYLIQTAWYMAVTDAPAWDFAVLFSGNKLERFHVQRDMDLERDMIEACRAFWFDYVQKRVEPPIDESESYGRYLARKFSLSTGEIIKNPSPEVVEWAVKMKQADDECKAAEDRKREANNNLRALVGQAQKVITPLGSIGWVRPEEKKVTDWQAAFEDVKSYLLDPKVASLSTPPDAVDHAVSSNTHKKQNEPYLRAWWSRK